MAVNVNVRRLRVEEGYQVRSGTFSYKSAGVHREFGRRYGNVDTDFLTKSFSYTFASPFTTIAMPIGWIRLYRMVNQGGKWIQQDVVYHHSIEAWLDDTHFEVEIADFENLDGVILEWYFTE